MFTGLVNTATDSKNVADVVQGISQMTDCETEQSCENEVEIEANKLEMLESMNETGKDDHDKEKSSDVKLSGDTRWRFRSMELMFQEKKHH